MDSGPTGEPSSATNSVTNGCWESPVGVGQPTPPSPAAGRARPSARGTLRQRSGASPRGDGPRSGHARPVLSASSSILPISNASTPPTGYHGVLAPNARLRAQVTAIQRPDPLDSPSNAADPAPLSASSTPASGPSPPRSPSIPWAQLPVRIYQLLPLLCSLCGGDFLAFNAPSH